MFNNCGLCKKQDVSQYQPILDNSIFPSTLTNSPVSAEDKHPHSLMLLRPYSNTHSAAYGP